MNPENGRRCTTSVSKRRLLRPRSGHLYRPPHLFMARRHPRRLRANARCPAVLDVTYASGFFAAGIGLRRTFIADGWKPSRA